MLPSKFDMNLQRIKFIWIKLALKIEVLHIES